MAELSRCYNKDCGTVRDASSRWEVQISSNSTCCVTTRHDNYSPCISAQEKAVTCYIALVGQHGATRRTRQARLAQHVSRGVATYSVDWGEHVHLIFPEVIPEIDVNPEHKMLKLYTWALLLIVVRHVGTSTARHARHVVHVVSWRDATSGIWAIR